MSSDANPNPAYKKIVKKMAYKDGKVILYFWCLFNILIFLKIKKKNNRKMLTLITVYNSSLLVKLTKIKC